VKIQKWSLSALAIVAMLAGLSMSLMASGVGVATVQASGQGTLTGINIGIFSDQLCQNSTNSINWGSVTPGSLANYTVFIKNTGALPETLSFVIPATSWQFSFDNNPVTNATAISSDENYFSLTWNYVQGTVLNPGAPAIPVTFSLSVANTIQGVDTFSFNIVVTGTQK
jgi:hypothetical protein